MEKQDENANELLLGKSGEDMKKVEVFLHVREGFLRRIITLFLIIIMVMSSSIPTPASVKDKETNELHHTTIRVAYYPLENFFEYDDNGNETGYGVELLNKISSYTGISFEYIPADSWESTKQMLLDGKADLRLPATMPLKPSTELSYSTSSIIDTYHVMLTLKTRDDLYYQDYDTIKTLKIGITESFYKVTSVKNYLDKMGVTQDQLVLCEEYNDCRKKLDTGEVDALVSNIMDMDNNMKMLARFNSISNYLTMTINNPMLSVLDDAIARIKLDEPLFLSDLYAKWFPERTVIPMTLSESQYLSSIDVLTFALRTNEGYLSRYEEGEYYGIYVEQVKYICEKLGINYRFVSIDDCMKGLEKADVYCGFYYDQNFADEQGYAISSPLTSINYYLIQKKGAPVREKTCKVAAIKRFYYTQEYLQKKYRENQLIYFDTYEQCLQAVANGTADITIINNYIAEYYLEKYQFSDLSARLVYDYRHLYCFATANNDMQLASILTKEISAIPKDEMNQFNIKGMERKPKSNYILAFMYQDPLLFTMLTGGLLALLLVLGMMIFYNQKSKKQNKALEAALSAKSDFLARMSHDMRTPLNAVLGFAKLAQDVKENNESVQDSIAKIESSGEYLLGLINDVLDASKIESGKVELHEEVVNGNEFLKDIINEFKAQGDLKKIKLITDVGKADTPYVIMDKLRTRQIYSNLLGNAFKFSEPGSTVEWYMEDTMIDSTHMKFITTITDHGCGMSAEFMRHMFEPFTQETHQGDHGREGTGLGLSIVKKLVELEGGTISVESKLGKGTTFTVRMMRKIPTAQEIESIQKEAEKPVDWGSMLQGKRILLCEDHPLNREITVRQLNKVGVITDCVENGKQAVEAFTNSEDKYYDAILMDIRMPVMDGMQAATAIRMLPRWDAGAVPIIAVTANAYNEDVIAARKAGMNEHLAKPIEPKLLYKTLVELIINGKDTVS